MNKKGINEILLLMEVVVAAVVIMIFIAYAKKQATGALISEQFLAKDTALMIDAMHALPGDAVFSHNVGANYTEQLSLYTFEGYIKLNGLSGIFYKYPYRQDNNIDVDKTPITLDRIYNNRLVFEKNANLITIKNEVSPKNG